MSTWSTPAGLSAAGPGASVVVGSRGRAWSRLAWSVGLLGLALAGCGGGDRVPVYPVDGKVAFKGEAPNGALIVFHPAKESGEGTLRPSAQVKSDGSFRLTTYDGNDGAPAGDYSVTIQWYKLVTKGKDVHAGPNVIPPRYGKPETSPLKVTIGESPNDLRPFEISE